MIRRPPRSTLFPYTSSSDLKTYRAVSELNMLIDLKMRLGHIIMFHHRSEEHTSELQSQSNLLFPLFFFNDTATTEIYTLSLHELFRSQNIQGSKRIKYAYRSKNAPGTYNYVSP